MALLLGLLGPTYDLWSGAPRGQHIGYCWKPDFAVMYADGQCAHYKTNSCKGLQVLRPDLPYTHFLFSLFLFFPERERGSRKRGDNGGTALCAEGPTRWPRGIRKLAKPDLLVSFTCLTRARTTLGSLFALLILYSPPGRHWTTMHGSEGLTKSTWLPPVYTPTCVHVCIRSIRLTVVIRLSYACAKDNPLLIQWELDIAYLFSVMKALNA